MISKIIYTIIIISTSNIYLSAKPIDLTESDMFVRQGFNKEWITSVPSETDMSWQKFPANKGNRPVRVRQLTFEGMPKFKHFSFKTYPIKTFTYVTSFNLTNEKFNSGSLALFIGQIGQNWEIYVNGSLLKSEVHLSKDKKRIKIERAVRSELIHLNHRKLKAGRNILAFKIIGDPIDDRTGLYMGKPYLIDHPEKLYKTKKYLLSLMIISIYIFFGLYHIFLFINRNEDQFNLAFGVAALTSALYITCRVEFIFTILRNTSTVKNLELLSLSLIMPSFTALIDLLVRGRLSKAIKTYICIGVISSITTLFIWKESILRVTQVLFIFGYLYILIYGIIFSLVKDIIRKNTYNKKYKKYSPFSRFPMAVIRSFALSIPGNLAIGVFILMYSTVVDIINLNKGIPSSTIELGYFIFVMGIALVLANRFIKVHNKAEDLNVTLEDKVEKRTEEIEKANQKLQEIDKQKTDFFTNISHEIRTPLTLILSPIEYAIENDFKNIENDFFYDIQKNAIRLLRLMNNLLDFSKIEGNKMDISISEVNIVQIIKNYVKNIKSSAQSKGINLSFQTHNETINLFLDLPKIDKICLNLFSNALKFTPKDGKIEIIITEDDDNCYIDFRDTGIGIHSNMFEVIFDRFGQADGSSTRKFEGTGIGLSLAKKLAEMHGGTISVKSKHIDEYQEDHGTTFTLTLPKGKSHLENRPEVQFIEDSKLEKSISDHKRFYGMREMIDLKESENEPLENSSESQVNPDIIILAVEDNADMRKFIHTLLNEIYQIHFAVDGQDGLDSAKELQPDLIITDVMMPKMNGYEMTKAIKEDESLKRIPILMLTAQAEINNKIEGLEYGADDYLTKPFNSKELLVRIKKLLENREQEKIIIERNEIIEEELNTAKLLQEKLLPDHIPKISGYRSHITYIPMDKVGGDFYDIKANDELIELLIADVSGHGLPGAFLSMITKMAFESISKRISPSNVLYQINDRLYRSTVQNNYVTIFYCLLDRNTNVLKFCNAGHFPPIVYRKKDDMFIELKAKGVPLGWLKSIELDENTIQLHKGDRLLLYTDGITECRNSDMEQFGDERFKDFIKLKINYDPNKFSQELMKHLKEFSGEEKFDDDLCLFVLDIL